MEGKEFQILIKKAVKNPSEGFTDDLMDKIIIQSAISKEINWKMTTLLSLSFLIFILSLFIDIPNLHYLKYIIEFPSMMTPILSIALILFVLNQFYQLRQVAQ